jgi:hypothetical protein
VEGGVKLEDLTDDELAAYYDAIYGVPADYDDWQPANEDGPRIIVQPDRDGYIEWDDEYETRFERMELERRVA